MADLPDYTKQTAINVTAPNQDDVYVKPTGTITEKASDTTTASYDSLCSHTVSNTKTFDVARVIISAVKASWVKYQWNGLDVSSERYIPDGATLIEHFPKSCYGMTGDGAKKFDILVKQNTEAGTITAEINGEES